MLPMQFRSQKTGELQTFLCSEIECRGTLQKKYRRAVNAVHGACAALGTTCTVSGTVGANAYGIGFMAGVMLEGIAGGAGLLDVWQYRVDAHLKPPCVGYVEAQHSSQPYFEGIGLSDFR